MFLSINSRVEKTAVLDIIGSKTDRKLIAKKLHDRFDRQVFKILDKKSQISGSQVETIVHKICPNVKFSIEKCLESYMAGYLAPKSDIITNGVKGHSLALRLKYKNKQYVVNYGVLEHEMTHFFDSITNPKFQIEFSNKTSGDENVNNSISNLVMRFYNKHLYNIKDTVKTPKVPVNQRINKLKAIISEFLEQNGFVGSHKIEVLQQWRYFLISENNASKQSAVRGNRLLRKLFVESVKDKADSSSKRTNLDKQIQSLKNIFKEKTKVEIQNDKSEFFFESKIKLIEQMIIDERKNRVDSRKKTNLLA